jgi:hypothetical protein
MEPVVKRGKYQREMSCDKRRNNNNNNNKQKHQYEHVPKSVETTQGGKEPYCGINKCKPTELSPIIGQIS